MGSRTKRIGVLFVQSQEFFGADSQIHASIMKHLCRRRFDVHCAIPSPQFGVACASAEALSRVSDLQLRPTEFGPTLEADSQGERISRILKRSLPAVVSLLGLARYARTQGIRIVHCTEKPRDVMSGMLISKLSGARCVVHVHVKAETWIRPVVRRLMHDAAALIGVSDFVAQSLRELGYDSNTVFAVLNGLELSDWIGAVDDESRIRAEFRIAPTTPLIVTASRLYRFKGQHDLLQALAIVKRSCPDVRLLIVGEDDRRVLPDEPSCTAQLQALCDQLDLRDNVTFTGFRTDVRALMAASDVFALPSFEEPFGLVFAEAMALGRPVVALDNGGTPEVVQHGTSGLLSKPGDVPSIAAHLVRLIQDPQLRRRLGERGRQTVIEHLNSARMTREVEQIYELVAAGSAERDKARVTA